MLIYSPDLTYVKMPNVGHLLDYRRGHEAHGENSGREEGGGLHGGDVGLRGRRENNRSGWLVYAHISWNSQGG